MVSTALPAIAITKCEALVMIAAAVFAVFKMTTPMAFVMAIAGRCMMPLEMTVVRTVVVPALRRAIVPMTVMTVLIVQKNRRNSAADNDAVIRVRLTGTAIVVGADGHARENQPQAQPGGNRDTDEPAQTMLFPHDPVLLCMRSDA